MEQVLGGESWSVPCASWDKLAEQLEVNSRKKKAPICKQLTYPE